MKNKIIACLFIISLLVIGGGLDLGSVFQTMTGIIGFVLTGGVLAVEEYKEKSVPDNNSSYPCFLKR